MAQNTSAPGNSKAKLITLGVLAVICVLLVYRNFVRQPASASGALPALHVPDPQQFGSESSRSSVPAGHRGSAPSAALVVSADPTLRLDLLEASRSVEYTGSSRNIFQVYIPPPPPPPPVAAAPPTPPQPMVPEKPPTPPVPLKFYGTAQSPGEPRPRAFLTDTEDTVFIAREGDVVAKFYRVTHIGVSSLEVEDTRTQAKQQLPIVEN